MIATNKITDICSILYTQERLDYLVSRGFMYKYNVDKPEWVAESVSCLITYDRFDRTFYYSTNRDIAALRRTQRIQKIMRLISIDEDIESALAKQEAPWLTMPKTPLPNHSFWDIPVKQVQLGDGNTFAEVVSCKGSDFLAAIVGNELIKLPISDVKCYRDAAPFLGEK